MVGKHVIILPELDSTSNYVAKLNSEGKVASGTVILAEIQTSGRGQRGKTWDTSHKKQFTASYFEKTDFLSGEHLTFFNMAIALAVRETISNLSSKKTEIKWPNDILIEDKKNAGLLIEILWENAQPKHAIIGIGINIHPVELETATSLIEHNRDINSIYQVLDELSKNLTSIFYLLKQSRFNEINELYHSYLWRKGVEQEVELKGEKLKIVIDSVNESGQLNVLKNNQLEAVNLQEIVFFY